MAKKTIKAYRNIEFLNSSEARVIRILSEYLEPQYRFRKHDVQDTIVFFGSSRTVDQEEARKRYTYWKEQSEGSTDREILRQFKRAEKQLEMSRYYEESRMLSRMLSQWSADLNHKHRRFLIISGGGPGIMEAANRGAAETSGGRSIGLNISIPTEQESNPYVTPELDFEFHYFFMRKFWFIYLAKACVFFPGGFGTMDELWEVLTLLQTKKVLKKLPVVLYGEEWWKKTVNFDAMVDDLVIDEDDLKLFRFASTPEEAFEFLKARLTEYFL